jgi:hypothetical protein
MTTPSKRPYFSHVRLNKWTNEDHTKTLGIAVHKGPKVVAHLTADEAIELSNNLVDLAERIQDQC